MDNSPCKSNPKMIRKKRKSWTVSQKVCSTGEGAQHTNLTQAHSGNLQTGAARSDHFHKVQSARRVVGPGTGLYPACLYVSCHLVLPVAAAPRGLPRWTPPHDNTSLSLHATPTVLISLLSKSQNH